MQSTCAFCDGYCHTAPPGPYQRAGRLGWDEKVRPSLRSRLLHRSFKAYRWFEQVDCPSFFPSLRASPTRLAHLRPVPYTHLVFRTAFLLIELTSAQQTRIWNAYLLSPTLYRIGNLSACFSGAWSQWTFPVLLFHPYSPFLSITLLRNRPPPRGLFSWSSPLGGLFSPHFLSHPPPLLILMFRSPRPPCCRRYRYPS